MASIMSHAVVATTLGLAARPERPMPARYWIALAITAALPDADVVAFFAGVPYQHVLGHRGLTHSLPFAAVLAALLVRWMFRGAEWHQWWPRLFAVFFAGIASHGMLDAMTTGGLGVAFFAPVSASRWFFPWRPILVSPIGVSRFFTQYGLRVMQNELVWLWLPSAFVALLAARMRVAAAPARGASR